MVFHEITQSLNELDGLDSGWRVAVCGSGPLVEAVKAQTAEPSSDMERIVVVDAGDDAKTLRKLEQLIDSWPGAPITLLVNVDDKALMRAVEARLFEDRVAPRPCIVNAAELVVERTLSGLHLFEMAQMRDQDRLHVALLGFGDLGRAFLDALVLEGVADGLAPPVIDIITTDVARAETIIRRDMPEIGASATITVRPLQSDLLGDPAKSAVAGTEAELPLSAIFVVLDDESLTLRAVADICALQAFHGLAHAPLFVGGAGAATAVKLVAPKRDGRNLAMDIRQIPSLATIDDVLGTVLRKRDDVARRIHEAYQRQYAGQTGGSATWERLPETYRRANRRAAAHLGQKLNALHLELRGDDAAVTASTHERVVAPLVRSAVEDEVMRKLARLEHERWCADRRLDGWRHGDIRDDGRRLHPSLVPFDDPRLSAEEIGKDVAQMRFLLGSVVAIKPDGATTCLHVGIVGGAAQPGLAVKDVQARFAVEPERAIVLISPLLSAEELHATSTLLQDLRASGRPARLIVPEWFAGNATLRDAKLAKDLGFSGLLADERVFTAPIGPQQFSASQDWPEVEVTEGQRQRLISYVTERADLLVSVQSPDLPS